MAGDIYGYIRVSSEDRSEDRQLSAEACGMPQGTFHARAVRLEKAWAVRSG